MPTRLLRIAAVVEVLSLAVLLANLATVHVAPVASALGPVHGSCYLVVVALAWQLPVPAGVRALALVPAVGGLLVLRRLGPAGDGDEPRAPAGAPQDGGPRT